MFIQTEDTPNEHSIKFKPGMTVMPEGVAEFCSKAEAKRSLLATKLFEVEGTSAVFFGPDFITVTKDNLVEWKHMKPSIYATIMDYFTINKNQPIVFDKIPESAVHTDDPAVTEMIKEIMDSRIRPIVQDDGGDIEFKGFLNGVVKLKLQGACKTCSSSVITLKNGIENMLKHYIPEVKSVEQVYDEVDKEGEKEFQKLQEKLNKK